MSSSVPILLSFYALSNGSKTLLTGQLTHSSLRDFSFKSYSTRKTFRTILALYRTRFFANQEVTLHFDTGTVQVKTDASGSFFYISDAVTGQSQLESIMLASSLPVRIVDGLYLRKIHLVKSRYIVVSDIDDTLLHSHISNMLLKFRTLMFTSMENRKAVESMTKLVRSLHQMGAEPFYLSNSEQNLYPLIYRFLIHNGFPPGPLFLKQMRKVRDIFRSLTLHEREIHKTKMLEQILQLFPDRKYFLLGDNTQLDLRIYLRVAEKHPDNVSNIIIRRVLSRGHDPDFLNQTSERLKSLGIGFYYSDTFPSSFDL
jgi:phosphatidate phosphatase APP1